MVKLAPMHLSIYAQTFLISLRLFGQVLQEARAELQRLGAESAALQAQVRLTRTHVKVLCECVCVWVPGFPSLLVRIASLLLARASCVPKPLPLVCARDPWPSSSLFTMPPC